MLVGLSVPFSEHGTNTMRNAMIADLAKLRGGLLLREPMKQSCLNVPRCISGHGESIRRGTKETFGLEIYHFPLVCSHRQGNASISNGSAANIALVPRPIDSTPSNWSGSTLRLMVLWVPEGANAQSYPCFFARSWLLLSPPLSSFLPFSLSCSCLLQASPAIFALFFLARFARHENLCVACVLDREAT